ncbi:hypothetical protein BD410DRAFT_791410 [Rickenella mellea]|uniref:Uncharacterized protein n=1 Tax=Rickenella mellea TaxID=50990 RepID=A0A4Y7PYR1_9AGAM|nr:hypothetical protein BD410DRAFT_791410 [Rickenella mellea]
MSCLSKSFAPADTHPASQCTTPCYHHCNCITQNSHVLGWTGIYTLRGSLHESASGNLRSSVSDNLPLIRSSDL